MALLSGEVETMALGRRPRLGRWLFRMALLSGEVETTAESRRVAYRLTGSGWLCYPGKLKPSGPQLGGSGSGMFRMALLSGEVETTVRKSALKTTRPDRSGWLCYPGKLKPMVHPWPPHHDLAGSGWLCYPGKLKPRTTPENRLAARREFRMALLSGEVETCLTRVLAAWTLAVPDGFAIRGS